MKIYVVKVIDTQQEREIVIGYTLTYGKAEKLALSEGADNWVIEQWPIGRRVNPNDRREAWGRDLMYMQSLPAGTLTGPHDGITVCAKRTIRAAVN